MVTNSEGEASQETYGHMDLLNRNFLSDVGVLLAILLITIALYWKYSVPGILLAGSLALTAWVAGSIVLLRGGHRPP